MVNGDIVHSGVEIPTMLKFMKENPEYGCVGYNPERKPAVFGKRHVGTQLMVLRTKAVKGFDSVLGDYRCDCKVICQWMYDNEWKADYVGYKIKEPK